MERKPKVFLEAHWANLILMNFQVPDKVLRPFLPPGLDIDRWEGSAYVSLVGFDFMETKVMGVRWPGYRNFPEINLRFYVRDKQSRGVSFVKEIVPQNLIAWIAKIIYNEPYVAAPIVSETKRTDFQLEQRFRLTWKKRSYSMEATGSCPEICPLQESVEHFFKEHEWGFGRSRSNKKLVYRVEHPVWNVYPVDKWNLDFDFGDIYGEEWQFLNKQQPQSVFLAKGSPVKVFAKI